jgi:hypothetical protein
MINEQFSALFGRGTECDAPSQFTICPACSAIQQADGALDALAEARAELWECPIVRRAVQAPESDSDTQRCTQCREIATLRAHVAALLTAAEEAHMLLAHYYIVRRWASPGIPEGVDWGDPHTLRHKAVDELWAAIEPARKLTRGY